MAVPCCLREYFLLNKLFVFLVIVLSAGCSQFKQLFHWEQRSLEVEKAGTVLSKDYIDHLVKIGDFLVENEEISFKRLNKNSQNYLKECFKEL